MNEWSFGRTHGQNNDPHGQVMGSYFTWYPVTPESDKFNAKSTGRSLDHIAAEQVNPNGAAPLVMQIGGVRQDSFSNFSYDKPKQIFPGIGSPTTIYNNLTGLFGQGPVSQDTYKVARGRRRDRRRAGGPGDPREGQDEPGGQAAALRLEGPPPPDHEHGQGPVQRRPGRGARVDGPVRAGGLAGGGLGIDLSKSTNVMMDLAVLSAICDQNRVIFMKFPGTLTFKWDGINHSKDSHGISHRAGDANMGGDCVPGVIEMIQQIDDWYAKKFAYLVGRLDSIDEGEGKLLDNTRDRLVPGRLRRQQPQPQQPADPPGRSCGGYFKTGQAVNVEGAQG